NLEGGEYLLKIKSGGPERAEMTKRFLIYETRDGNSVFKEPLKVIDTSAPYLPGEEAELLISSSWSGMKIHLEYEHDNMIFKTEDIQLDRGQRIVNLPILKEYQEGVFIHVSALKNNRVFSETVNIEVTPIDRLLDLSLETYRDKMLPGSSEQWRINVSAQNGDKAISELLLSMYDASLDQFKMHAWTFNPWREGYPTMGMDFRGFGTAYSRLYSPQWYSQSAYVQPLKYPTLNRFGYTPQYYSYFGRGEVMESVAIMSSRGGNRKRAKNSGNEQADMAFDASEVEAGTIEDDTDTGKIPPATPQSSDHNTSEAGPQVRRDFKETAFFYPDLRTDADGNLVFSFTMPESLTTWKFQAMAHSKKLQSGSMAEEVITQKDLMVVPNSPRFLREDDRISFSSKLVSLSDEAESGSIRLELLNSMTMEDVSSQLIKSSQDLSFELDSKESAAFEWEVEISKDYSALTYRFIAEGIKHSDGEEDAVPVLSNRMLVTEAMPFAILKEDEKQFDFTRMNQVNSSSSLEPHALTLEFTANPIWYAVQAMPYMMEYPYDCSEQIFTRYYANSLASDIIEDRPRIREVINNWKDFSPNAFLSNLEKNQELKYVLLEETPWVMEAKDESERKKRLSLLLDVNHMAQRQEQALEKLIRAQDPSGGWPWFAGMRPNLYITQYILSGLGHLKHLGILDESNPKVGQMINNALRFLDQEHLERWSRMKRYDSDWKSNDHTGPFEIQYLYARTFYQDRGLPSNGAFEYYKEQASEYWLKKSIYMQGMSALALNRLENQGVAQDIMRSVKEQSMMDDDLGMYWKKQN
ncbi:MAG: hypothetical protein HKO93_05320, partial [Flavobacteriales bacterium]|nr:hypothetical protein [Flavobacteriales bacterium]